LPNFSDFIVYADESGDHGMVSIDPQYPMFALTFCVMRKDEYVGSIVPEMQRFKFGIWGHDSVILHEHEIRKNVGHFGLLRTDRALRARFFDKLNALIDVAPMTIFASVIDKEKHRAKYANPWNPYEIALHFCMEQLQVMMNRFEQHSKTVHVVFESRGAKEDAELELEFRRIASNKGHWGHRRHDFSRFDFQPVFIPKAANASGLQLADLTARPIALSQLRPDQPNRAFEIIRPKLGGLKCFP
jgi:hypothetical protein